MITRYAQDFSGVPQTDHESGLYIHYRIYTVICWILCYRKYVHILEIQQCTVGAEILLEILESNNASSEIWQKLGCRKFWTQNLRTSMAKCSLLPETEFPYTTCLTAFMHNCNRSAIAQTTFSPLSAIVQLEMLSLLHAYVVFISRITRIGLRPPPSHRFRLITTQLELKLYFQWRQNLEVEYLWHHIHAPKANRKLLQSVSVDKHMPTTPNIMLLSAHYFLHISQTQHALQHVLSLPWAVRSWTYRPW